MDRVKSLRKFTIQSEIPDNFEMRGTIPFDMKISNGIGTFTVYAASQEEAVSKVDEYLNK